MMAHPFFGQKNYHHCPHSRFRDILNTSPLSIWCNLCLMCVNLILLNVRVLN
jgi:hypothetical protein